MVKYICKEPYFSRMIVKYSDDSCERQVIVKGSGSQVNIPGNATDISVRFQNMRFFGIWCDVKKYDCYEKYWIKPTMPHVFNFSAPVARTFTLEGSLYYVAVMKATDEHDEECNIID